MAASLVIALLAAPVAPAMALEDGGRAIVAEVVDGDTVILEPVIDGPSQVRLVGIQAPKLPLGRKDYKKWPLADTAKAALMALAEGRAVQLKFGGRRMDRHGRLLAHLYTEEGTWIQGALLAAGLARVYSFPDNRALVPDMLVLERAARRDGKGIWSVPFYAVRGPENLEALIDTFQLVEGRVLDAAFVRGNTYLNFGADWRTDFTVMIDRDAAKLFKAAGDDPLAMKGARIRVRGWLNKRNGPMIEVSHPEQIEKLDP
ncbi:MAG: thermonuclease family protein [Rhodospirillaceae bacterium]|nr:thermonuclease family protein [Rhodospirillaceae bacterium]